MKRNAEKQITKDTADEGENDTQQQQQSGTFTKAAPDVLRARRILKVRRTSQPSPAPSNPFASAPSFGTLSAPASVENGVENKSANGTAKPEPVAKVENPTEEKTNDAQPEVTTVTAAVAEGELMEEKAARQTDEAKKDEAPVSAAVDAPEVDEDANKTNQVATPVAIASKNAAQKDDGQKEKDANASEAEPKEDGNLLKVAPDPAVVPTPATSDALPKRAPFVFGGGAAAVTSFADAASVASGGFTFPASSKPTPSAKSENAPKFEEKTVVTGEEDEEEKFRVRAKVFILQDGRWLERGIGQLKLNQGGGAARLVMRTEATLRLALNAPLYDGFKFDRASERAVRFLDMSADPPKCFLIRISNKTDVDRLIDAVDQSLKKEA